MNPQQCRSVSRSPASRAVPASALRWSRAHRRADGGRMLDRNDPQPRLDLRLHPAAHRCAAGRRCMTRGDRMRRRDVVLVGGACEPVGAAARPTPGATGRQAAEAGVPPSDAAELRPEVILRGRTTNMLGALAELGYVDGQNVLSSFPLRTISSSGSRTWRPSSSQGSPTCCTPRHRGARGLLLLPLSGADRRRTGRRGDHGGARARLRSSARQHNRPDADQPAAA